GPVAIASCTRPCLVRVAPLISGRNNIQEILSRIPAEQPGVLHIVHSADRCPMAGVVRVFPEFRRATSKYLVTAGWHCGSHPRSIPPSGTTALPEASTANIS